MFSRVHASSALFTVSDFFLLRVHACNSEGGERRRELFVILLCIYLWMFSLCLHKVDGGYNLVMNSMNTNLRLPLTLGSAKDQNQTI